MNERLRSRLVAHGALLFLAGMAAGFPFAFEILGRIELWPLNIPFDMPGDVRGWRMAHLEGILNGILLIAVAAVGGLLRLEARAAAIVGWGLIITGWGNVVASWIGPLSETRGLNATGLDWNTLVFALFMAAIVAVLAAMWLVFRGARTFARALED
jgi:hypothetical protein